MSFVPDQEADGLLARRLADLVEVRGGDREDELLGRVDPERHQDVDVGPDVVAGRDLHRERVERRLAARDDVADDDPRRRQVVAGPEGPGEPAALEEDRPRALRHRDAERPEDARGRSAGRRARTARSGDRGRGQEQADTIAIRPADHELVADPEGVLRQDDDRQPAGRVRRSRGPRPCPRAGRGPGSAGSRAPSAGRSRRAPSCRRRRHRPWFIPRFTAVGPTSPAPRPRGSAAGQWAGDRWPASAARARCP